jgi:phospholipid-binding lipoprotein MlaA
MKNLMKYSGLALMAIALVGCATSPTQNPRDPIESFNRVMFSFNDAVDEAALKPVAEAYKKTLPEFVQSGVGNFFGNLGDVWTAVNNLLQGKGADGTTDLMRVAINSTFGLGGLINIASSAGLPKHKEDFGQTLGKWGVSAGPYIVLPLLGPSTTRDTIALPLDWKGDLWRYTDPVSTRYAGSAVRVIGQRAGVLDASNLIEEAALDRYEFVRDAYLQRRQNTIDDGDTRKSMRFDDNGRIQTNGEDESLADGARLEPFYKTLVNKVRSAVSVSSTEKR